MKKAKKSNQKTSPSRRDFLKQMGLAASVSVPFFNSKVAMGQTTNAPTRVLFVFLQHGWQFDNNRNITVSTNSNGTINSFPTPTAPFNAVKDQCVVVNSLRTGFWGNAHDVSYSDILSCAVAHDAPGQSSLYGGPFMTPQSPTIDWAIGNATGKQVLRLSHHYGSWGAAHHPLSFDNNLRSLPYFTNARDAYMAVIDPLTRNTGGVNVNNAVNDALLKALGANGQAYLNRVSGSRREKMETYIQALNALGNRILMPGSGSNVPLPPLPGMSPTFAQQLDSYLDMIRVCFAMDTHRVAVLGLGEGVPDWTWRDASGATRAATTFNNNFHHGVAHYDTSVADAMRAMHGWTTWYSSRIAAFVDRLKTTIDVDGRPMIDNTLIVLTGEVGNGTHDQRNFQHVVIGGGGQGRIRRNRVISLPTFDPRNRGNIVWASRRRDGSQVVCDINYGAHPSQHHLADLWVSVARLAGLNINSFGFDVYNRSPIQLT